MESRPEESGVTSLPASEFRPRLDSYNGPLDLLLFLIKKEEVDILDIPVARVVEQYRLYLRILQTLDPNACGDFLVLLAQLIEIKSKLLLPKPPELEDDEEYDDPRLELVQQLLDFKKYKERAMLLEDRFEEFQRRYRRPAVEIPEVEPDFSLPLDLGGVSVWDLLTAFHRVQLALGNRGPHRVVLRDRPLSEYVRAVEELLEGMPDQTAAFMDLFAGIDNRYDAIGILLAVLEMGKQYRLEIRVEELDDEPVTELAEASVVGLDSVGSEIVVRLRSREETERIELEAKAADDAAHAADPAADPAAVQLLKGEGEEARVEPIAESASEGSPASDERDDTSRLQSDGPAS